MDRDGFRHEMKYICTDAELSMLEKRLSPMMQPDRHATPSGTYLIRSIYFDDTDNSCFRDNENGVSPREKWRIRCYDRNADHLSLECKRRESNLIKKRSCLLTREQFEALLNNGAGLSVSDRQPPLLNRFILLVRTHHFMPKVIVQYERRPLIYRAGNVRVTFDRNIASSDHFDRFFAADLPLRPVMPTGRQLLEIKYDAFLPDFLSKEIQLGHMRQETFSKYYLCRRYMIR